MSVTLTKSPGYYAFTGNPVVFEFETDIQGEVTVGLTIGDNTRYLSFYPIAGKVRFDIAGLLRDYMPEPIYNTGSGYIGRVAGFNIKYSIDVNGLVIHTGYAFRGGISNELIKQLYDIGHSIFTYRLANDRKQFLFTSRTNGPDIILKDTELSPFVFIHPGTDISFVASGAIVTPAELGGTICTANMEAIYKSLQAPEIIDVYSEAKRSFRFVIEKVKPSEERYLVRFRNSLGAIEHIELTGHAYQAPEYRDEVTWQRLGRNDFFEEQRERTLSREVVEIESGYKTRAEHDFIQDMIKSDEIYFSYPNGPEYRCLVTAENIRFRERITEPGSVRLKIRLLSDSRFAGNHELLRVDILGTEDRDMMVTEDDENTILV